MARDGIRGCWEAQIGQRAPGPAGSSSSSSSSKPPKGPCLSPLLSACQIQASQGRGFPLGSPEATVCRQPVIELHSPVSATTGMRSRLLISVALLPTISENSEMMMLGNTQAKDELQSDLLSSQSLDDYVKSICQLAQPTSVLDGAQRLPYNRLRKPCRLRGKTFNDSTSASHSEKSSPTSPMQDITAHFSGQHSTLTLGNNIDPLDWLFGESQPKRQSWKDTLRRTGLSTDPSCLHKQNETGKSRVPRRVRACEAKIPGGPLTKLSSEWGKEKRTQPSMLNAALKYSSNSHQDRIPRVLNSNLPVIYEL